MRVVTGEAKGRKLKAPKTMGTRPIIDRVKTALFDILSTRVEDARFLDLFAGTGSVGIEALSRGAAKATFIEKSQSVLKIVRENLQITGLADRAETLHADAFKFLQDCASDTTTQGDHKGSPLPYTKNERHPKYGRGDRGQGDRDELGYRDEQGDRKGSPLLYTKHERHPKYGRGDPLRSPGAVVRSPCDKYDIIYVAPPQYQEMAARALGLLDRSPLLSENGLVIVQIHPKERSGVAAVPLTRLRLTDERRYGSTLLMFYESDEKSINVIEEKSANVDTTTEA